MRKDLAGKFAHLRAVSFNLVPISFVDEELMPKVETHLDTVLNEIFSVDPVSGAPKGDISYYLTENGNPQVKDWIQRNLLQPRAVLSGSDSSRVSDDLICEFSRIPGESNEAYASRLYAIRMEAEENIKKYQSEIIKNE